MLFFPSEALASASMPAPICDLTAKVIDERVRDEQGQGMSGGIIYTYHDVEVTVISSTINSMESPAHYEGFKCDEAQSKQVFQLRERSGEKGSVINQKELLGACIRGKTHFFADGNFMGGNWLYDVEQIPEDACTN